MYYSSGAPQCKVFLTQLVSLQVTGLVRDSSPWPAQALLDPGKTASQWEELQGGKPGGTHVSYNNYKDLTQQTNKETKPTIKGNKQTRNAANDQPVVRVEGLEQGGLCCRELRGRTPVKYICFIRSIYINHVNIYK